MRVIVFIFLITSIPLEGVSAWTPLLEQKLSIKTNKNVIVRSVPKLSASPKRGLYKMSSFTIQKRSNIKLDASFEIFHDPIRLHAIMWESSIYAWLMFYYFMKDTK